MHPMGIALAFLVFWSLVAAGTFLLLTATMRLRRVARPVTGGTITHPTAADGLAIGFHVLVGLLGTALVAAGLYATYVVVFAR